MKIKEYTIVRAEDHCELASKVLNAMSSGWQPKGTFKISPNTWFYQELVKYEEKVQAGPR